MTRMRFWIFWGRRFLDRRLFLAGLGRGCKGGPNLGL